MSKPSLIEKITTSDRFLIASKKVRDDLPVIMALNTALYVGRLCFSNSHLLEITAHTANVGVAAVGICFTLGFFNKDSLRQLNAFRSEEASQMSFKELSEKRAAKNIASVPVSKPSKL